MVSLQRQHINDFYLSLTIEDEKWLKSTKQPKRDTKQLQLEAKQP